MNQMGVASRFLPLQCQYDGGPENRGEREGRPNHIQNRDRAVHHARNGDVGSTGAGQVDKTSLLGRVRQVPIPFAAHSPHTSPAPTPTSDRSILEQPSVS
jgi:hypothetical protein